MKEEVKNFFSGFKKLNKKWLISAFLFFAILGLILSWQPILAQGGYYIRIPGAPESASVSSVSNKPFKIPGFGCWETDLACKVGEFVLSVMIKIVVLIFFGIPLLISLVVLTIAGLILGWVISPGFISWSFTQNPFVDIGLSITRDFANMGFILFLVVIALATALRIEEYKARKTLPILIIIALLINFSPVFTGFIIDATNVVMDFFLNNITGIDIIQTVTENTSRAFWDAVIGAGFDLWANISAAMKVFALLLFNFYAAFIFIIFAVLFTVRYIMLWILVILSPVAFVSYILPITRRGRSILNWNQWWQQFVEWSTIGIIGGFFLYLGFKMIDIVLLVSGTDEFISRPGDPQFGLLDNVLPYLIPLILLHIGYKEAKKTSAMFAQGIIQMPEKIAKTAAMAAVAFAGGAAIGALKAPLAIPRVERARARLMTGVEKTPLLGRMVGGPGAYEAAKEKKIEKARKEIEKIPDTPQGNKDILARISRPALTEADRYQRAAGAQILSKRKALDITPQQAEKWFPEVQQFGANIKTIYQGRPDLAQYLTDPTTRQPMTIAGTMAKIEPREFWRNVQKEALRNPDVVFHAALDERKFEQMTRNLKAELKREFKTTFFTAPPRPLTSGQIAIIRRRIKQLRGREWRV